MLPLVDIDPERDKPVIVKAVMEAGGHIVSLSEIRRMLKEIYLKVIGEKT